MAQLILAQRLPFAAQAVLAAAGITCSHYNGGSLLQADDKTEAEIQAAIADPEILAEILAESKAHCEAMVDKAAGEARARHITTSPGQEMTYAAKLDDAKAYKSAGYPTDISPYAWVAAEQLSRGGTAQQACDYILATAAAWVSLGAQIEQIRQLAKIQIKAESDTLRCEELAIQAKKDMAVI